MCYKYNIYQYKVHFPDLLAQIYPSSLNKPTIIITSCNLS